MTIEVLLYRYISIFAYVDKGFCFSPTPMSKEWE
jgi:hypothetical protein